MVGIQVSHRSNKPHDMNWKNIVTFEISSEAARDDDFYDIGRMVFCGKVKIDISTTHMSTGVVSVVRTVQCSGKGQSAFESLKIAFQNLLDKHNDYQEHPPKIYNVDGAPHFSKCEYVMDLSYMEERWKEFITQIFNPQTFATGNELELK